MKKGKIDGNARNAWWAKFTGLLSLLSAISFIIAGAPHADAEKFTSGTEQAPLTPTLKTGDYVWKPAVSPAGPVVIIVSVPEQTLYVYRNGVRIGRSTVSTGKSGHRTPTGVFTILQKNEKHTSSIYKGASMPYMSDDDRGGVARREFTRISSLPRLRAVAARFRAEALHSHRQSERLWQEHVGRGDLIDSS